MSKKKLTLFIILVLSAIYVGNIFFSKKENVSLQNNQTENSSPSIFNKPADKEIIPSEEKLLRQTHSENNIHIKESACPTPEEQKYKYINSPLYAWENKNNISKFNESMTYYRYLNEEELLKASKDNDPLAMYILGLNYQWNSSHDNFQSLLVKPDDAPTPSYKRRKFDQEMNEKSRYWLYQSALQNQPLSISAISQSYKYEIHSRKEGGILDPEEEQRLKNYKRAFLILYESIIPNIRDFYMSENERYSNMQDLSIDEASEVRKIVKKLQSEWKTKRAELGYPEFIEIDIPDEVRKSKKELDADSCG